MSGKLSLWVWRIDASTAGAVAAHRDRRFIAKMAERYTRLSYRSTHFTRAAGRPPVLRRCRVTHRRCILKCTSSSWWISEFSCRQRLPRANLRNLPPPTDRKWAAGKLQSKQCCSKSKGTKGCVSQKCFFLFLIFFFLKDDEVSVLTQALRVFNMKRKERASSARTPTTYFFHFPLLGVLLKASHHRFPRSRRLGLHLLLSIVFKY